MSDAAFHEAWPQGVGTLAASKTPSIGDKHGQPLRGAEARIVKWRDANNMGANMNSLDTLVTRKRCADELEQDLKEERLR